MSPILINDLSGLREAALEFIKQNSEQKIFAFYGSMGAGKTTIIKAICTELGAIDAITSPSFTLVNEYNCTNEKYIYHFDFYRINKAEEVLDFGFEEYIDSGMICFMEWPERIEDLLPENTLKVNISVNDDMSRIIEIMK